MGTMKENGKRVLAFGLIACVLAALWAGAAAATGTDGAGGPGEACILTPQFQVLKQNIRSPSGRTVEIEVAVGGRQAPECGPVQYGVDFTNAYDAPTFYLGVSGAGERQNLFMLEPGQVRIFKMYAGIVPGTAMGNYTLQMTAYSEADHWKQTSQNVSIQVEAMEAGDTYWATQLYVGWNTVPFADGVGVFGCPAISEGYVYSPSREDYVRMVREGATFAPADGAVLPAGEKNSGLFVFSKQRCAIQSLVPPEIFERTAVPQEKEHLLTASPVWTGLNSTQLAAEYCPGMPPALEGSPNPLPISLWNAFEQRWERLGNRTIQNGQVLRLHERTFACSLGG